MHLSEFKHAFTILRVAVVAVVVVVEVVVGLRRGHCETR